METAEWFSQGDWVRVELLNATCYVNCCLIWTVNGCQILLFPLSY